MKPLHDHRQRRERLLSADVAAAILKVLDYLLEDERRDSETHSLPDRKRHIYASLQLVERWLEGEFRRSQKTHRGRQP